MESVEGQLASKVNFAEDEVEKALKLRGAGLGNELVSSGYKNTIFIRAAGETQDIHAVSEWVQTSSKWNKHE